MIINGCDYGTVDAEVTSIYVVICYFLKLKNKQKKPNNNRKGATRCQLFPQAEKESEMSHHRSPNMVHQDRPGHLEAFYQVELAQPYNCKIVLIYYFN